MNHKVNSVRKILASIIVIIAAAGFTSCEKFGIPPIPFNPDNAWSFSADVQPIFNSNKCTDCHNGSRSPDLRTGKSYAALSKGYLNVSDPANSRLYVKITSTSGTNHLEKMPLLNDRLTILNWIKQGAKNN